MSSDFHLNNETNCSVFETLISNQNSLIDLQRRDMKSLKNEIVSLKRKLNSSKNKEK